MSNTLKEKINALVCRILEMESLPNTLSKDNIEQWDSLKHIEIIFALEEEVGCSFDQEALALLDSIDHIYEQVLKIKDVNQLP